MMKDCQALIDARNKANEASDARQAAWDELNVSCDSENSSLEQWYMVDARASAVQEYYDELRLHVDFGEPYPCPR